MTIQKIDFLDGHFKCDFRGNFESVSGSSPSFKPSIKLEITINKMYWELYEGTGRIAELLI